MGKPLSTLSREDFAVYENGIKQEISHFEPVNAPINLVLMLDLSGSTRDKREVMLNAARNFVDSLSPQDRVAVTAFTREYYVVSDFTTDRKLLKERISKLKKVQGGTSFYDAMWTTLELLSKVKDTRKAIVVLTDGVDEQLIGDGEDGSRRSFDELIGRVSEEDVTIYPIHLNPELPRILERINLPNLPEEARERLRDRRLRPHATALKQLEMMAEETAGVVFKANDESDLDGVYQRVAAELRLLYSLAYSPESVEKDGKFRKIGVEVKRDGVITRTRRGYYAK
jgi:VWFA-related protein